MPLAQFSDPVKVIVSLCCKTLWDERIPNRKKTLLCNCLIPFCLTQEKESDTEAQMVAVASLIFTDESDVKLNVSHDAVRCSSRTHPPLFYVELEGMRGLCCLCSHRWSVLYDPDVPSLL